MVDITVRRHPLVFHDHLGGARRLRCPLCSGVGTLAHFMGPMCSAWAGEVDSGADLEPAPPGEPEVSGEPERVTALEMGAAPMETTGAAMPSRVCSTHEDRTPGE